jgi:hypothetical protein
MTMQATPKVSESGYKEFLGFDEVVRDIKSKDMILSRNLAKNCKALLKNGDILLVFTNNVDKNEAMQPDSMAMIREALDAIHMQSSKVTLTVGSLTDYLGQKTNEEIMAESANLFID